MSSRLLRIVLILLVLGLLVLQLWRRADRRAAEAAWAGLASEASGPPLSERFDPSLVADLPEPARRYFRYSIRPGTRLSTVAEISMEGEIGLGTRDDPRYQPMQAEQILAPPHGFVWRVGAGSGLMRMSGSDGLAGAYSWVRFWLLGIAPVARSGGSEDHWRSSFGRVVAEGAFWAPASLLPENGVVWERLDENTARARVDHRGVSQTVDVHVDADGRPLWVRIDRWSDANPEGEYRLQPFGGYLNGFEDFDGYLLPTLVDGGNFFGTEDFFPFYRARVDTIRMLYGSEERLPWR